MPSKENPIKIPDIIPEKCGDCEYFTEKKVFGFFDSYLGTCEFYDGIEREIDSQCLAVTRYGKSQDDESYLFCPKCEKPQNKKAVFCKDCGAEISPKELITISYCKKCESEYDESNKFCEKCGNQLDEREVEKITKIKDHSSQVKKNDESGFGWGKFWIVMGFLQGGIALVFSIIIGIQDPQYLIPITGILSLSILGIGSAYGIMQRKLFGLYLVYTTLIIGIVKGLLDLVSGEEIFSIQGATSIVLSILWFTYFNKRKEMFS